MAFWRPSGHEGGEGHDPPYAGLRQSFNPGSSGLAVERRGYRSVVRVTPDPHARECP